MATTPQKVSMQSFHSVSRIRTSLKMKLSNYSWYQGSRIDISNSQFSIKISVKYINNQVKQVVPSKIDGVEIKLEQ